MTTLKVNVIRKPTIKVKVLPNFPSSVTVTSPILLSKVGGNFAFSFDSNAFVVALGSLYQPIDGDLTAIAALNTTGYAKRTGANVWSLVSPVDSLNGQTGALTLVSPPQARLSLTSAVAVTTSDVTAATTVYLMAGSCPTSDGTNIIPNTAAQLSVVLDSTNHLSGKNFDVFKINDAGTMRIGTGPTWNSGAVAGSDTARGTGAGSTDISLLGNTGIWVNTNAITIRYSSVATVAVAAGQAVYLGSIRTTANGQTEDSVLNRFLFNAYNVAERKLLKLYQAGPDNYSIAAWTQAHSSALSKVTVLLGLTGSLVTIDVLDIVANSTATARIVHCGVGLDSTTVNSADITAYGTCTNTIVPTLSAHYRGNPGLGFHTFNGLEYGTGTDTQSWFGNASVSQAGIRGSVWA